MRKLTLMVAFSMLLQLAFAGGLLTNYNQSAQYIRMLSRNAALEIDAVFYNPAGLVKMEDGWHFAFYSQTIFQNRDIDTNFPTLNSGHYEGETTIPVFPDLYAVYKKNNWAYSIGVGPIGGGGTAEFPSGVPTLEIPVSNLGMGLKTVGPLLSNYGIPAAEGYGYSVDMALEASSTFWGIQLGASYAFSDNFSVYGGARIMPSVNKYVGALKNIDVPTSSGNISATEYLAMANPVLTGAISNLDEGALGVQAAIDAGIVNPNDPVQDPALLQLLGAFGNTNATNQEAVDFMLETSVSLQTLRDADVADKEVDTKQKGIGFTPIIGFNYSPNNDWTFAFKYEFETKLTLENETKVDNLGLFPDGAESSNDIPAFLGAGIGYRGLSWLEAQLSCNIYFDKDIDYGYNLRYSTLGEQVYRDIDGNFWELALGLQFNVSDNFAFSVGGMRSKNGITSQYQSDFSYSNSSHTLAGGIMWNITDKLILDAGVSNTFYEDDTVTFTHEGIGSYDETYAKTTLSLSAGISYSIF